MSWEIDNIHCVGLPKEKMMQNVEQIDSGLQTYTRGQCFINTK